MSANCHCRRDPCQACRQLRRSPGPARSLSVCARSVEPRSEWAVIDAEPATAHIPVCVDPRLLSRLSVARSGGRCRGISISARLWRCSSRSPAMSGLDRRVRAGAHYRCNGSHVGGQKGQIPALKVAAYSATAARVSGIFLRPLVGILARVGALYSLHLVISNHRSHEDSAGPVRGLYGCYGLLPPFLWSSWWSRDRRTIQWDRSGVSVGDAEADCRGQGISDLDCPRRDPSGHYQM